MARGNSSRQAAKYEAIGRGYYKQSAQVLQDYEATVQRAKEQLRGLQQRRKGREIPDHSAREAPVAQRREPRRGLRRATARRLFGAAGDENAGPTVKSIRGAT